MSCDELDESVKDCSVVAEQEPGRWSFRPRITRRAWNDFDTEWGDEALSFLDKWWPKRGPGRPRRNEERNREWAKRYHELDLQLNDPDDLNGERPISKEGLAALIAREDYEAHRERWTFDPEANALTRKRAAEKIKKAIKPLI
jgi:hypothetical protein